MDDNWLYDQQTLKSPRHAIPNGRVLVTRGGDDISLLARSDLYDAATGTWAAAGSLGTAREWHTSTLLPNGKVLVAGGLGSGGISLSSAELYSTDPTPPTDACAALQAQLTAAMAQIVQLQNQVSGLTATNTALATQNGTLTSQVTTLTTQNSALTSQISAANTSIQTLTAQLVTANTSIQSLTTQNATLTAQNTALTTQLTALQTQTSALSTTLGTLFNNPGFQIPGATLTQQIQALSTAIGGLNPGQKQALYFNLGGVKK